MQATQTQGRMVLADLFYPAFFKSTTLTRTLREALLVTGGVFFVALTAQIALKLPWTTVPITGQTFGVLVVGGALGAWRGAGSLLLYMLLGMASVPVYAPTLSLSGSWDAHFIFPWNGTHSLPWDISSGGYIVGFIFAAFVAGWFAQKAWDRGPWGILSMLAANAILYIPGLLWLAYLIGTDWIHPVAQKPLGDLIAGTSTLDKTLKGGLYPFIVGDMMKLYLAALTLPAAWKLVDKFKKRQNV